MKNETVYRIKKLTDTSLKNVCAGAHLSTYIIVNMIAQSVAFSDGLGCIACLIANRVYSKRASMALHEDKIEKSKKYSKISKNLFFAATSLGVTCAVGIGVAITADKKLKNDKQAINNVKNFLHLI